MDIEEYANYFSDQGSSMNNTSYQRYSDYYGNNETILYPNYPGDDDTFQRVKNFYSPYHGFLSLAVCFFGIIANVANIIVLTR